MKLVQVILFLSLLLLLVSLLFVESSSLNDTAVSNITRGSSLSTSYSNDTSPYLLSPSRNIAFGFYQLPCSGSAPNCSATYIVGIWFVKSPLKTLVWTANRNDLPLHKPSSIVFTNDGKLVLHIMPDNEQKPLIPDVHEPVSYARMHDDGNFVLYCSDSQIVWQSFDYPTDTILGGQKLRPGVHLISGRNRLSVQETDGLVAIYIYAKASFDFEDDIQGEKRVISHALNGSLRLPVILNLDITGDLCLVASDDVVLKYLYRNKNQQRKKKEGSIVEEDVHLYRATLDSRGHFNLYKERIDGNISTDPSEKSSILVRAWRPVHHKSDYEIMNIIYYSFVGLAVLLCVCFAVFICR